jgi:ribosomal protein L37AE/L43A
MRIECKASELSARIDEAWHRERQEPTCPECDSSARLSEDGTECYDCQASDYLEEAR